MRRVLPLLLAVLTCSVVAEAAAAAPIALRIEFRADSAATPRILRLVCSDRSTGTVSHPAAACRKLRGLGTAAFRPTPRGRLCTQISGGPSTARVTGAYLGRSLWVTLSRDNGCEIARWQRVAFLLPPPSPP